MMKTFMTIGSKSAIAGIAFVLASVIPGNATVRLVPAEYSTIQAAVDAAASGDVIQIAPGVYTNQVVIINKSLTLSGSPGTVLRATANMQFSLQFVANAYEVCLLGIFESTNVVVSGLTFEGDRLADTQRYHFTGIWFLAAGGCVEDCRITGFRGSSIDSPNVGYGVAIVNPHGYGAGVRNLDILRSTFADNAVSVQLQGDTPTTVDTNWNPGLFTTFTVNDNLIVGNGPDDTGAQFGIAIFGGAGGEVKRNTIADHDFTGTYSTNNASRFAYGVLAIDGPDFGATNNLEALQPVHFEGNSFRSNQFDLVLVRGDGSTIVNNSFEGNARGRRPTGLAISGDNVVVATNRFSDMDAGIGILLLGDDPEFGTYTGIASNAVLVANGFCNVATNVTVESPATKTEQGTLECPEPTLNVTRAVLLTWPYDIQGYAVESAPAMDGPWTTNADATVFLQNGQSSVAVPADSNEQYFRLVKQP